MPLNDHRFNQGQRTQSGWSGHACFSAKFGASVSSGFLLESLLGVEDGHGNLTFFLV